MRRKFKHTSQQKLAASILEFIDWELEPTPHQKLVRAMIAGIDGRVGRQRGPKILMTMEITKLRGAAMETLKNQIIAHTSGICDGSVISSFKRFEEERHLYRPGPRNYQDAQF